MLFFPHGLPDNCQPAVGPFPLPSPGRSRPLEGVLGLASCEPHGDLPNRGGKTTFSLKWGDSQCLMVRAVGGMVSPIES